MLPFLKRHKFKVFFLCLIVFLIFEPLDTPVLDRVLGLVLIVAFAFSPYLINPGRGTLACSLLFVLITLLIDLVPRSSAPVIARHAMDIIGLGMYFAVVAYIFWYTLSSEVVSTDLIYLSLCGYFLIGFGFFLAYSILQNLGLVVFAPKPLLDRDELIYYSYTALTTLGFGDFVPVSDLARRLTNVESCTGVLYVAVFIGRLIGLRAGLKKKSPAP